MKFVGILGFVVWIFLFANISFAQNAVDGLGPAQTIYQNSLNSYSVYWSGFTTLADHMKIVIQQSGGPVIFTSNNAPGANSIAYASSAAYTNSALALSNGTKYFSTVSSVDVTGTFVYQQTTTTGVLTDSGLEVAGTVNNVNSSGVTVTVQNSTNTLYVNWSGFSDAVSGIAQYRVGVGTYQGGVPNIVPLTTYSNLASSATFTGLSLTRGTEYYALVQGVNGVGIITAVAGGNLHTAALRSDGMVFDWGDNSAGELGNGNNTNSSVPVQVRGAGGVGAFTNGIAIAGGDLDTFAVDSNGNVWAWGNNNFGQLGNGTTTNSSIPVKVLGPGAFGNLSNITQIESGVQSDFATALKSDGTVWAWGNNDQGQLGNGTQSNSSFPVQVTGLTNITTINGSGIHFTAALKNDGTVWMWGINSAGQLGQGTTSANSTVPVQVKGPGGVGFLTGIIGIAAGTGHTIALKNDGTVWAWGSGASGQLGNGGSSSFSTPVQVQGPGGVGFLTGVVGVDGGADQSMAFKADGTVWAWGNNSNGQLGDGTTTNRSTPVQVLGSGGGGTVLNNIIGIGDGDTHTISLKNNGTIWTWGHNNVGQLGNNSTTDSSIPVQVTGFGCATAASAGVYINPIFGGTANITNGVSSAAILYQSWSNAIYANWANFGDVAAAINQYQVGVLTNITPTSVPIASVTYANTFSSATFAALTLTQATNYYVQVVASDVLGNTVTIYSNSVMVDTVSPSSVGAVVNVGPGPGTINFQSSLNSIQGNWSGFIAPLSGIASYLWSVGTYAGGKDITPTTNIGAVTAYTNSGLSLTNGAQYFVTITAVSGAGLYSTAVSSNGVIVDSTPPVAGTLSITATANTTINATWSGFTDPQSGVVNYQFKIGTISGGQDVYANVNVGLLTSVTINGLTLTVGATYYVTVTAVNGAGGMTPVTASVTINSSGGGSGTGSGSSSLGLNGSVQQTTTTTTTSSGNTAIAGTVAAVLGAASAGCGATGFDTLLLLGLIKLIKRKLR